MSHILEETPRTRPPDCEAPEQSFDEASCGATPDAERVHAFGQELRRTPIPGPPMRCFCSLSLAGRLSAYLFLCGCPCACLHPFVACIIIIAILSGSLITLLRATSNSGCCRWSASPLLVTLRSEFGEPWLKDQKLKRGFALGRAGDHGAPASVHAPLVEGGDAASSSHGMVCTGLIPQYRKYT